MDTEAPTFNNCFLEKLFNLSDFGFYVVVLCSYPFLRHDCQQTAKVMKSNALKVILLGDAAAGKSK